MAKELDCDDQINHAQLATTLDISVTGSERTLKKKKLVSLVPSILLQILLNFLHPGLFVIQRIAFLMSVLVKEFSLLQLMIAYEN